jgi:hypothetical protein
MPFNNDAIVWSDFIVCIALKQDFYDTLPSGIVSESLHW